MFGESPAGTSTAGYPDAPIDYLQVGAGVHASGSFCPKCRDETDGDGSCSPASPSLCEDTHASTTPIDTPLFTSPFEDMTDFDDVLQLFGGTDSFALHAAPDPILLLADISTTPIDTPLFTPLF
ncbi:hypothetical protein MSAN_00681100 [Mycena sanguinolenta]|uniref:Uncharacterized protein n=1 Tax=Mycena sanguinolenta TaxID=230812 RepID=A0A8H6Z1H1_9AGAR|nr:hypothetical protein MSAN_00681100 [Mycena sanguinolenta]